MSLMPDKHVGTVSNDVLYKKKKHLRSFSCLQHLGGGGGGGGLRYIKSISNRLYIILLGDSFISIYVSSFDVSIWFRQIFY